MQLAMNNKQLTMKRIIILLFICFFANIQVNTAQIFPSKKNINPDDSLLLKPIFPILNKYDSSISLYVTGFISAKTDNCEVIAKKNNKWYQFTLIVPHKLNKNGRFKIVAGHIVAEKPLYKYINANQEACKKMFDEFNAYYRLPIDNDSLNEYKKKTKKIVLSDQDVYTFLLVNPNRIKKISCYGQYDSIDSNSTIVPFKKFVEFFFAFQALWPQH